MKLYRGLALLRFHPRWRLVKDVGRLSCCKFPFPSRADTTSSAATGRGAAAAASFGEVGGL